MCSHTVYSATEYTRVSTNDICIMTLHGKQGVFLLNHRCYTFLYAEPGGFSPLFPFSSYRPKLVEFILGTNWFFPIVQVQNKHSLFCIFYACSNIFFNVFFLNFSSSTHIYTQLYGLIDASNVRVSSIIYSKIWLLRYFMRIYWRVSAE